jgi:hypothetical protein
MSSRARQLPALVQNSRLPPRSRTRLAAIQQTGTIIPLLDDDDDDDDDEGFLLLLFTSIGTIRYSVLPDVSGLSSLLVVIDQ